MTATNAYDELSGQRLDSGRGYDKRSVETFRARALDLVDELLRQVTELEDRLSAGGEPALSEAETDLVTAFRSADSFRRREALAVLGHSAGGEEPAEEEKSVVEAEFDDWLHSFNDRAAPPSDIVGLVPVGSHAEPEPAPRVPLRVAQLEGSLYQPTPLAPWAGWVD